MVRFAIRQVLASRPDPAKIPLNRRLSRDGDLTMRSALAVGTLLFVAITSLAAEDAKPNHLTAKEAADGWLLLFDGESTFGWRGADQWTVADGVLSQGKESRSLVTSTPFQDYELSLEIRAEKDGLGEVNLGCDADGRGVTKVLRWVQVIPTNDWAILTVSAKGSSFTDYKLKGGGGKAKAFVQYLEPNKPAGPPPALGHIALSGSGISVRSIKLRPTNLESIFNGKDLTGWKEFAGKKTKFSVTKDGLLNLKDGPGDLQTQKAYDNFVVQVDCFTNGKNLNSGVFFRCRPDEYQQGYEAQIHNGFTAEPTKEYTIEEYDAQSHELKGSKKEKYTAIDYGTGAIYRRIPARKQVAKDEEWFTMTVAAQERHIAVWVNGIQVTDWVDNRPMKDNARNGCRLEKGPISLQGHDPTTDLNFRNIRIAETSKVEKKE
jgi:hypothetical protein